MASVDAVLVAYDSGATIGDLVEALRAAGCGRVVVVDHGSDGAGAIAAAHGAEVVEQPWNPGYGAGQNAGVRRCDAPFVLLLNPDAEVVLDGLRAGLRHLAEHGDVAAVQGVVVNRSTLAPERSQGVALGPLHLLGRALGARRLLGVGVVQRVARRIGALSDHVDRVPPRPVEVESLAATAVLVRRDAFLDVGGFDESYFLYGEDLDLCRRLRGAGWRLVAMPDRWATHESGGSSASWWDREVHWWAGTMRYASAWWPPASWTIALFAAALRTLVLVVTRPSGWRHAVREVILTPVRARRLTRWRASAPVPPGPTRRSRGRR